jgi:hypothetical protein
MSSKEFRPGASTLVGYRDEMATPAATPGKRTLTESLPPAAAKSEPKGGGTAKGNDDGGTGDVATGGSGAIKAPGTPQAGDAGKADAGKTDAGKTDAGAKQTTPAVPMDTGGTAFAATHVTPSFVLSESEGARSNSDPATTRTANPTFTGKVVKDGSVWRYQITSAESKGTINLVYYTADHYPAPTPNDDSGDLSNVTKTNYADIITDLKDHRTIVAGNWSSYRRTYLHEHYHWETEWQGQVKAFLITAENEIAKLSSSAATESDASTKLAPKAKKIFDDQMKAARKAYNDLPDTPGSAPYIAGAAGVDALIKRIEAHAKSNSW